ncbi:MAG: choice-of-anchor L domain-containing protein [Anaerolineales bacterium]|nr:choice-of-anchor L domain-containing protein [Anaerolineales bacterium]
MRIAAKSLLLIMITALYLTVSLPASAVSVQGRGSGTTQAESNPAPAGPATISPADADQLAAAMNVPGADLNWADLMGSDTDGVGVSNAPFANWFPRAGGTFAILSTGLAANAGPPKPPTGPSGKLTGLFNNDLGDVVRLQLNLHVPNNVKCLSFDFAFHSTEFPQPSGTIGNDTFTAQLDDDALSIIDGVVVAPGNFAVDGAGNNVSVKGGFSITTFTQSAYYGATSLFQASTPVTGGSTINLYLSIQDLKDDEIDSAVFLDNFRWSTQACQPGLKDLISTVYLPLMAQP